MLNRPSEQELSYYTKQARTYAAKAIPAAKEATVPFAEETLINDAPPEVQSFLKEHPGRGTLRIQSASPFGIFPIPDSLVEIVLALNGNRYTLYRNTTDRSGIISGMELPALPAIYSQKSSTAPDSGTTYLVSVFHPDFEPIQDREVQIFDGVETIVPIGPTPSLSEGRNR